MRRAPAALAILASLSFGLATPAFAGPPWISIEIPANPFLQNARDAFCLVRVYHHGDAAYYPVHGTAEGLVDGARRSVKLSFVDTGVPGVYAVRYAPEKDGTWMLVMAVGEDDGHGSATVLVPLTRGGQILSARVPTRSDGRYMIPQPVSSNDIDRMLRDQAAQVQASAPGRSFPWAAAGLALVPVALVLRRRGGVRSGE
jgi:hypothetical protein